jgi:hypothetical protein
MPAPRSDRPAETVKFNCQSCHHTWQGAADRVEDAPDAPWHPYDYWAECPECGAEAPQDRRQWGSWKGAAHATGPRTDSGKAASAANLDGYPTAEQTKTLRFNALKTGKHAQVAQFFPAKPGRYAECEHCPYYSEFPDATDETKTCIQVPLAGHVNDKWCKQRLEIWAVFQRAFEDRDPGQLAALNADLQYANHALVNQMLQELLADGVTLKTPVWSAGKLGVEFVKFVDPKTGEEHQLVDVKAHPILKYYLEMLSRNKLDMDSMGMTARHAAEDDVIEGHLSPTGMDDDEYMAEQQRQLANMQELIAASRAAKAADPVVRATPALSSPDDA